MIRIIIGRTVVGGDLCASCCGQDAPDDRCRACGKPGDLIEDGRCPQCVLTERVRDLLSDEHGTMPAQLVPLVEVLANLKNPYPALTWLRRSQAARLLAELAARPADITHELLDTLPQHRATHYLRGVLVTAGVLPQRHEYLARLELWLATTLPQVQHRHMATVRPYAEWCVLREARRLAARGRYTQGALHSDYSEIRACITFMEWLDGKCLDLTSLDQEHFDLWLCTHPTQLDPIAPFLRWAQKRRLTGRLELPRRHRQYASNFLSEDELRQQLHRCLNDEALPREMRIVGALIRLYALPVTRIVTLTTDRFHREGNDAYLTIGHHPVILPPKLAKLIEDQITHGATAPGLARELGNNAGYLLPGAIPGTHRDPLGTAAQLKHHAPHATPQCSKRSKTCLPQS